MTWVNIALRCNRNILVSTAAAAQTFDGAWTLVKVDHKVEEVEELAVLAFFDDNLCQFFILGINLRQVLFGQRIRQLWIGDNRLDGNLFKALFVEVQDIVGKVLVVLGEGAADVVLSVAALLCHLLEFGPG